MHKMAASCVVIALAFVVAAAQQMGEVKESYPVIETATVAYTDGETACEGFVAYDSSVKGRRPAILIVHDWMGRGKFDEQRAREVAALGYVGFSVDVYGKDVRPKDRDEARKNAMQWYGDRAALRARLKAALAACRNHELVDPQQVAVMGYCFGGSCSLELARSGADIVGAISFHGALATDTPAKEGDIKAKVLILHGADDPGVGQDQVSAVWKEMTEAKADWQLVAYGNAVHSFTNPAAGNDNSRGSAYNESADKRSWIAMKNFFAEIFG